MPVTSPCGKAAGYGHSTVQYITDLWEDERPGDLEEDGRMTNDIIASSGLYHGSIHFQE
jgi:hypothetical protein